MKRKQKAHSTGASQTDSLPSYQDQKPTGPAEMENTTSSAVYGNELPGSAIATKTGEKTNVVEVPAYENNGYWQQAQELEAGKVEGRFELDGS
jgi:hypothetical protein